MKRAVEGTTLAMTERPGAQIGYWADRRVGLDRRELGRIFDNARGGD